MEVKYKIYYLDEVIKKHIPAINTGVLKIIQRAIQERLMVDPLRFGQALRYDLSGHRKLRIGNYRIIYMVEDESVTISAIKHRKDIYKK